MQKPTSLSSTPCGPGVSVVLKNEPDGRVMTITKTREDGEAVLYTTEWLDEANQWRQAEYEGKDLLPVRTQE